MHPARAVVQETERQRPIHLNVISFTKDDVHNVHNQLTPVRANRQVEWRLCLKQMTHPGFEMGDGPTWVCRIPLVTLLSIRRSKCDAKANASLQPFVVPRWLTIPRVGKGTLLPPGIGEGKPSTDNESLRPLSFVIPPVLSPEENGKFPVVARWRSPAVTGCGLGERTGS
jgi:hypothetical protein